MKFPQFRALTPFLIFLFFFTGSLMVRFSVGTFVTADDPFFHARMSHAMWNNYDVTMPRFSTQYDHTSNLYLLYHATMSPFVGQCAIDDFTCIIRGSQIFHSFILGIFAAFAYLLFRRMLMRGNVPHSSMVAFILTILMFLVSRPYLSRMLMERPIVWSLLFFGVFMYALLRKHDYALFFIPLVFVFSYSVSIMLLIPAGIFMLATFLNGREATLYGLRACGLTLGGFATGVLLRPDTYNYLLNAYGSHAVSIWQSLVATGNIAVPNEFYSAYKVTAYTEAVWFWVLLILMIYLFVKSLRMSKTVPERTNLVFVNATALFFMILYSFFFRAMDYMLFTIFFAITYHVAVYIAHTGNAPSILKGFLEQRKALMIIGSSVFLSLCFIMVRPVITVMNDKLFDQYFKLDISTLTDAIREDYAPGDVVFATGFGMYAKLIFYDYGISYPMGMDSSFTRLYDEKLFWQIQNATLGRPICPTPECTDPISFYDFMKHVVHAKYVIIENKIKILKPFADNVRTDARFEKAFSYPPEIGIELYRVN